MDNETKRKRAPKKGAASLTEQAVEVDLPEAEAAAVSRYRSGFAEILEKALQEALPGLTPEQMIRVSQAVSQAEAAGLERTQHPRNPLGVVMVSSLLRPLRGKGKVRAA